ncbi:hypothetical protein N665_0581s0012 [Sinapis alba]|nr:hypothetical protein N665_0581s0012 [Sinapis alba]
MPRKWQKYDCVRGFAFNIPINHYTPEAITALGDLVGKDVTVAFDLEKPHNREYFRVQVRFNVVNPLRKSRIIKLKSGESVEIFYFYERVQKRCYHCQRMTHEQSVCPLLVCERQNKTIKKRLGIVDDKQKLKLVLSENDPLFGIQEENQVGIHPILGRSKITAEVLDVMRKYLRVAEGEERKIREERVRKSIKEVEINPVTESMTLRLEEPPVISKYLNKGKGLVFGYNSSESSKDVSSAGIAAPKLMGAAIATGKGSTIIAKPGLVNYNKESTSSTLGFPNSDFSSTVYKISLFEGGSSRTIKKQGKPRRRPYVKKRKLKALEESEKVAQGVEASEKPLVQMEKRKDLDNIACSGKSARQKTKGMVPDEGPSKSQ